MSLSNEYLSVMSIFVIIFFFSTLEKLRLIKLDG